MGGEGTGEAEDLRGGSKNIENAPLFSGEARVRAYAREAVEHASETEKKDEAGEGEAEGKTEETERESERKAGPRGGPRVREQLERIVFTRGMTG